MLDFKNKLEKVIIDYFIKYNINPSPVNDGKIINFDSENQIHYINSLNSASNLNLVVSKNLVTKEQYNKAVEIIKVWQDNKEPFTWVIASNSETEPEKNFFAEQGFIHSEKIITMVLNLDEFHQETPLSDNEKFQAINSLADVEKFRSVIKRSFPLSLIDLQKYYGLYELNKTKRINYQVYLTVDGQPASTGQFYLQDGLVILDDIATSPDFRKRGLAKKMLHHLLNTAKQMGYHQAALIATPDGYPVYQKLGFQPIKLYFDVYEINY